MINYKQQIINFMEVLASIESVNGPDSLTPENLWFIKEYRNLVNALIRDKKISKYLTKNYIINELMHLIKNLYNEGKPWPSLDAQLILLDKNLLDINKTYIVLTPLMGFDIEQNSIPIGDNASIKKVSCDNLQELVDIKKSVVGNIRTSQKTDNLKIVSEQIIKAAKNLGEICLELHINAGEKDKAMELAMEASHMVISFIRYIEYLTYNWDQSCMSIRIPGYSPAVEAIKTFVVDDMGISLWEKNSPNKITLSDSMLKDMIKYGLDKFIYALSNFLSAEIDEMHYSILNSLIIFSESRIEVNDARRFLKLMLATETLINTTDQTFDVTTPSEKLAFILGKNSKERIELAKYFEILYKQRETIIREGTDNFHLVYLYDLEYYAAELLKTFLTEDKWFLVRSKHDLENKFNTIKYA